MSKIVAGIYQHYKGNFYKVLHCAQHSETEQWFVCYQALYGDYGFWVRPLDMFAEQVTLNGKLEPRFKMIKAD